MSLSEKPSVKITYNTASNISDEILGGAIQFCRETGYKQNIMMLTFFWSAFLLSAKEELVENGVLHDTINCYPFSIGQVFPQVLKDMELKEKVSNMQQHYWNQLSSDFNSLCTETEVFSFIKIANKLNDQGENSAANQLKQDPVKTFSQFSSAIQSSIYRILHCIDNNICIKYKGVLDEFRYARVQHEPNSNTISLPKTAPTTPTVAKERPLGMAWYKFLIYFSLIASAISNILCSFLYILGVIYPINSNGLISAKEVYAYFGIGLQIVDISYGVFLIFLAILTLILRQKLAKYNPDSLTYVKLVYSLSFAFPLLYVISKAIITKQPLDEQTFISTISGLIFLILNLIYFKKRAHLFVGKKPSAEQLSQVPHQQTIKNDSPVYGDIPETPRKSKAKQPKKLVNKELIICITATLIATVIISVLVIFLIIPGMKYNHAKSLLENGNYELAYSAFKELDGFSDSENMCLECRYVQAVKYRDAGDYDLANKIFKSLGNYRDSKMLIHEHSYRVVSRNDATCTVAGNETLVCSGCKDSYTNYLAASHNYIVTKTIDATCTANGSKVFECSVCHDSYSELLEAKPHAYSSASCTMPKTCRICGKTDGEALGHSNSGVRCSRCGEITFETLSFAGTGSKTIDYSIPAGKFKITVTMTSGKGSVEVKVHYSGTYGDTYEMLDIYDKGNSKVEYIYGPTSGTIVVNASNNYYGNSGWKVTIEAVDN